MSRVKHPEIVPPTFGDVWGFERLLRAFLRARRAKRGRGGEPLFYLHLEENLLQLSRQLRGRTFRPDPIRYFHLWNKKDRIVSEASFRDRIVHHSLVAALEPTFEGHFIFHSYACRKDKGVHRALGAARKMIREFPFFLKLDVKHYFDNVRHDVLLDILGRHVHDDGLLWLCRVLLDGTAAPCARQPGVGIPIGNLTSQFWANVYLDTLDHLVRDELGSGPYLRYMDDMLLFGHSKAQLWEVYSEIREFCQSVLRLRLKEQATVMAPVSEGIPWLGFRIYPGLVRVDGPGKRRFAKKLRASYRAAMADELADEEEKSRAASLVGHLYSGDCYQFRVSVISSLDKKRLVK